MEDGFVIRITTDQRYATRIGCNSEQNSNVNVKINQKIWYASTLLKAVKLLNTYLLRLIKDVLRRDRLGHEDIRKEL